ncbi:MAG TPA: hypothetical protein VK489_07770 [Ferruginibacter sp.]|nr:hypothetical protein [Ferruginibacter sp.]
MSSLPCFGQEQKKDLIVAKWKMLKFGYLKPVPDSVTKELNESILTFSRDSVVITRKKESGDEQFVKSGPYRFSHDQTYLYLGKDSARILILDNVQLQIRTSDKAILYLTKIDPGK